MKKKEKKKGFQRFKNVTLNCQSYFSNITFKNEKTEKLIQTFLATYIKTLNKIIKKKYKTKIIKN